MKLKSIIAIFLVVLILFSHQLQTFSQWDESWPQDCTYAQCGALCCISGCCPTNSGTCLGSADCVICGDGTKQTAEGCDDGNVNNGDGCSSTCTIEPINSSTSSSSSSSSGGSFSSSSSSSGALSSSSSSSGSSSSSSSSSGDISSSSSSSGGDLSSSSSSSGGISSSSSSSGDISISPLKVSISGNDSVTIPQGKKGANISIKVEGEGAGSNTSCSLRSDQSLLYVRFYPRSFFVPSIFSMEVIVAIERFSSEKEADLNITAKCGEDSTADFKIRVKQK